jgi:hypothetical protein
VTIDQISVETPVGLARASVHPAPRGRQGTLVLGHGAGGGIDARDLVALASALPAEGISVVLVEPPWRLAGRRVAAPPRQLDVAWTAVLGALEVTAPLVVGGRSAGARVACRTARAVGAGGCVALAFPLHPPGRPERSRVEELLEAGVPTLVVQGERDPFGSPPEFPVGTRLASVDERDGRLGRPPMQFSAGTRILAVPWADHSFGVPARAGLAPCAVTDLIVGAVLAWWPKS